MPPPAPPTDQQLPERPLITKEENQESELAEERLKTTSSFLHQIVGKHSADSEKSTIEEFSSNPFLSAEEEDDEEEEEDQEQDGVMVQLQKVFGQPLDKLAELDEQSGIPLFLRDAFDYLIDNEMETEGLFRLSGLQSTILRLREHIDTNKGPLRELLTKGDGHAVCGLVKLFLRSLPIPLLTFRLATCWCDIVAFSSTEESTSNFKWLAVRTGLAALPQPNLDLLRELTGLLARLVEHREVNMMGPANVASLIGPNLLWPNEEISMDSMQCTSAAIQLLVYLIEKFDEDIFEEVGREETLAGIAQAIYDYNPEGDEDAEELPLIAGDIVYLTTTITTTDETDENGLSDWSEGFTKRQGFRVGRIPSNHLSLIAKTKRTFPTICEEDRLAILEAQVAALQVSLEEETRARLELTALVDNLYANQERLLNLVKDEFLLK